MLRKFLQNYLRFWARWYLGKRKPKIVAVTGSVGKTSTKDAIFEVLKIKFNQNVRKSEGNLNTVHGLAMAILGFKKPPIQLDGSGSPLAWLPVIFAAPLRVFLNRSTKYLVLEIAADQPGDIKFITTYVKPDVTVITNIAPAHYEIFGSLEKIIEEKTELLRALSGQGYAVLNIDDNELGKIAQSGNFKIRTFAINKKADVMATNVTSEITNFKPLTKFQVITDRNKFLAQSPTLGRVANIYQALAAVAVANIFGFKNEEIIQGLNDIKPEKHRMQIFSGQNKSVILDDAYNANPLSMRAALETLKILPAKRKIAVLGDMLELGKISKQAHVLMGEYVNAAADLVISVGSHSQDYKADHAFLNTKEAISFLLKEIREGDMILIKASRGMQFEQIVEALISK